MGKKKQSNPALHSKLIIPGAEAKAKSQLLVPEAEGAGAGARLVVPGVDGQPESPRPNLAMGAAADEVAGDGGADVGAEETGQFEEITEEAVEPAPETSAPVRISAMAPPPVAIEPEVEAEPAEEVAEPVAEADLTEEPEVAVAMATSVDEEIYAEDAAESPQQEYAQPEYAEQAAYEHNYEGYGAPAEQGYAGEMPTETWQQQPTQGSYYHPAQQPSEQTYYQPQQQAYYPAPTPVPAPPFAPPYPSPPLPQRPTVYQQAPYGYGGPPVAHGYPMPGQMPGGMYGRGGLPPQRSVPSWALILVGLLVGFLVAMAIFKFTGMGAALRGDLIEEGQRKAEKRYQAKIKSLEGGDEEEADEPDPEPKPKKEKVEDPPVEDPPEDKADEPAEDEPAEDEAAEEKPEE